MPPPEKLGRSGSSESLVSKLVQAGSVVGFLVAVAAVNLWRSAQAEHPVGALAASATASAPSGTATQAAERTLEEARQAAGAKDFKALALRLREIPEDSPLRQSPHYAALWTQWADAIEQKVDSLREENGRLKNPDRETPRALLTEIAEAPEVDPGRRQRAREALAQMVGAPEWTPVGSQRVIVEGATIEGAQAVIQKNRKPVRECYQKGLTINPDMEGRAAYKLVVNPRGAVTSATVTVSGSLLASVGACIKNHLRSLTFAEPSEGETATVSGVYTFIYSSKGK